MPCSGCVYSALCQFPFTLPRFTPTAVPQVLAWFRSPFGSLHFSIRPFFCFLSSACFRALATQPLFLPFPSSRFSLTVVLSGAAFCLSTSAFRFIFLLFPGLRLRFWYLAFLQFLFPFSASALQVLSQFPTSSFEHGRPHSFRLRFGYLGWVIHPEN